MNTAATKTAKTLKALRDLLSCGCRAAKVDGIKVCMSGMKRGLTQRLKADIKRRSAIEPR
jgi:hypothetical protein